MEIDRKKLPYYLMILTIVFVIIVFNFLYFNHYISVNEKSITDYDLTDEDINPIRENAVAGLFYPANVYQLEKDIDNYLQHVTSTLSNRPKIMIVPHAGYKYSAQVAAHAYKRLIPYKNQIKNVFLLGPSHYEFVDGVALSPAKQFNTPLGNVNTNTKITSDLLNNKNLFKLSAKAHKNEHALEVQIPFLQKTLENFTIIPMLYGKSNPKFIAEALAPYLKKNNSILIISADLSHYLDYETARNIDEDTAKKINNSVDVNHHQSCGATAVNTAIALAKDFGLIPHLLNMANSGDVTGDKSKVVGYGSWIYDEPNEKLELKGIDLEQYHLQNFARHNKRDLVKIVKKSLNLAVKQQETYYPSRDEFENVLFDKGASFVTLYKNNKLRGCIGSLYPSKAIAVDLADNTYAAALKDTRFKPLTMNELEDISFTISLLTNFEPIEFKSYDELLSLIKPNIDGIFIKDGQREGLFLPSVWKDIPNKDEFITNLKIKAGLSPSYWSEKIQVFRFRTVEINNDKD